MTAPDAQALVLVGLAERVEGAEGASRALDAEIMRALGYEWHLDFGSSWWGNGEGARIYDHAAIPTASLDFVIRSIIDPTWFFHVSRFSPEADGRGQAHIYPNRGLGDDYEAEAATPALALTAACLRARASLNP